MADKRLDTQKTAIPVVKSPDRQGKVASVNKGADNPIGAGGYDEQQREEGRQRYLDAINGNAKDAAAAQEREDRQRRWSGIVSSISDGITALNNIYFANKGAMTPNVAPNMGANNYRRWRELDALRMQQARLKADDEHRLAELRMRRDAQMAEQRRFDLQQQRLAHESAERMAETQRHNREMERLSGYRTDAGVKRAEDDNKTKVDIARIRSNGGSAGGGRQIITLSDGTTIDINRLSSEQVANIWGAIPQTEREQYLEPVRNKFTGAIEGYRQPTLQQMRTAIMGQLGQSDVERYLRNTITGGTQPQPQTKKKGYNYTTTKPKAY